MHSLSFKKNRIKTKYEKRSEKLGLIRKFRVVIKKAFLVLMLLILITSSVLLYNNIQTGVIHNLWIKTLSKFWIISNNHGMTLDNIYLSGQIYTSDQEILEQLNLNLHQPILSVDLNLIKANLENLPWIKNVSAEREFPNTLHIKITEKKPIALWQYKNKFKLIDSDGEIIPIKDVENFSNLIILVGDSAYNNAEPIIRLINNSILKDHVLSLIYVGQRRWNIRLKNGIEIKLPENNVSHSIEYVTKLHEERKILDDNIIYIDLRIPDKMYIKTRD